MFQNTSNVPISVQTGSDNASSSIISLESEENVKQDLQEHSK